MLHLKATVHYVNKQEMLWDFPVHVRSQDSLLQVE